MSIELAFTPTVPSAELTVATADDAEKPVLRITTPVQLLNLVPYLFGFHPDNSLVVIGTKGSRPTLDVTQRFPLRELGIPNLAAIVVRHTIRILTAQQCTRAFVVGYGPEDQVTPLVDLFQGAAAGHGIDVPEIIRTDGQRYWSYACTDPTCCPPEGTPYELRPDPAFAHLLHDGATEVLASRESLAELVAPATGADATAARQATRRAEARMIRLLDQVPASAGEPSGRALVVREGIEMMTAALQIYRVGGDLPRSAKARLTVALRDLQVRDDAWSRLDADHAKEDLRLLLDLTRIARGVYVAAPASLLAFVAWRSGNGALANVALARALGGDRNYKLADTLSFAVLCLPPSMARMPFTPEMVAEEYRKRSAADGGRGEGNRADPGSAEQ